MKTQLQNKRAIAWPITVLAMLVWLASAAPTSAQQAKSEKDWAAAAAKKNSPAPITEHDMDVLADQVNAVNPELLKVDPKTPKPSTTPLPPDDGTWGMILLGLKPEKTTTAITAKPSGASPTPPPSTSSVLSDKNNRVDPKAPKPGQLITDKDVDTLLLYSPPIRAEDQPKAPPSAPPKPPQPLSDGSLPMLLLGLSPDRTVTTDITAKPPKAPPPPAPTPASTTRPDGKQDLLDRKEDIQAQINRLHDQNSRDQTTIADNPNSRDNLSPDINYRQQQIDELNKQKSEVEGQIQRYDRNNTPTPSLADSEPSMGNGGSGSIPTPPSLLQDFTNRKEKDRSDQTSSSWVDMKNQSKDSEVVNITDEANQKNKNLLAGANADAENTRDTATRTSAQQQDANSWGKVAGNSLVDSVKQGGEAFGKTVGGTAATGFNRPTPDGGSGYAPPDGSSPSGGSDTPGSSPQAPSGGNEPTTASGVPSSGSVPPPVSSGPTSTSVIPSSGSAPSSPTPTVPLGPGVVSGGSPEDAGAKDFYGKATPVSATRSAQNRQAFNAGKSSTPAPTQPKAKGIRFSLSCPNCGYSGGEVKLDEAGARSFRNTDRLCPRGHGMLNPGKTSVWYGD